LSDPILIPASNRFIAVLDLINLTKRFINPSDIERRQVLGLQVISMRFRHEKKGKYILSQSGFNWMNHIIKARPNQNLIRGTQKFIRAWDQEEFIRQGSK